MPIKAPRICVCGNRIAGNAVCICRQRAKAEADKRRPSAAARGYDSAWSKARSGYLTSHPTCVMVVSGSQCGKPASVLDHVKRHNGNRALFWDKLNWQALCTHCHNSRKQSLERRNQNNKET
jgi:5-methylcytosine-specific restriction protein A